MLILLTTLHIIICLFLILVVLLQQGKGADLSVFGGGSTQAVFGARGAATLLHKLTVVGFIGFILTTIGIGLLGTGSSRASVMSRMQEEAAEEESAAAAEGATQDAAGAPAATVPAAAEESGEAPPADAAEDETPPPGE